MKLYVLSDLHLEFQKWRRVWDVTAIDCDAHVLAGDIGNGFMGLEFALKHFTKPVIYVAGNHEFYSRRPMQAWWRQARVRVTGSHVHPLENDSVVLDGVRFLGCTVWTDYALFGDARKDVVGRQCEQAINDFAQIFLTRRSSRQHAADPYANSTTGQRHSDRLTWTVAAAMHGRSRDFLASELDRTGAWDQTVVVTHHAPSINGIEDPDNPEDLDAAYASHLDHLVAKADLWIHGHVHRAREYQGTQGGWVVQNARGYADSGIESVPGFRWNRVVDTQSSEAPGHEGHSP